MAVGRSKRRAERRDRVVAEVGEAYADSALDLVELAWHDCYGEMTPPHAVIEDILILGQGRTD